MFVKHEHCHFCKESVYRRKSRKVKIEFEKYSRARNEKVEARNQALGAEIVFQRLILFPFLRPQRY